MGGLYCTCAEVRQSAALATALCMSLSAGACFAASFSMLTDNQSHELRLFGATAVRRGRAEHTLRQAANRIAVQNPLQLPVCFELQYQQ